MRRSLPISCLLNTALDKHSFHLFSGETIQAQSHSRGRGEEIGPEEEGGGGTSSTRNRYECASRSYDTLSPFPKKRKKKRKKKTSEDLTELFEFFFFRGEETTRRRGEEKVGVPDMCASLSDSRVYYSFIYT